MAYGTDDGFVRIERISKVMVILTDSLFHVYISLL